MCSPGNILLILYKSPSNTINFFLWSSTCDHPALSRLLSVCWDTQWTSWTEPLLEHLFQLSFPLPCSQTCTRRIPSVAQRRRSPIQGEGAARWTTTWCGENLRSSVCRILWSRPSTSPSFPSKCHSPYGPTRTLIDKMPPDKHWKFLSADIKYYLSRITERFIY